MSRRSAFTLIELLVVIAIVAILVALLMPVFVQARHSAMQSAAIQTMRQLGLATVMYSDNYEGRFPPSSNYGADPSSPECTWHGLLVGYTRSENVFRAPTTDGKFVKKWEDRGYASIGMNSATAIDIFDGCAEDAPDKTSCQAFLDSALFSKADEPSRTAMFAVTPHGKVEEEYRGYEFNPYNGLPHPDDLRLSPPLVSDKDLVKELFILPGDLLKPVYCRYFATGEGGGMTPIVFADGHVKSFSATTIQRARAGIIWRFR